MMRSSLFPLLVCAGLIPSSCAFATAGQATANAKASLGVLLGRRNAGAGSVVPSAASSSSCRPSSARTCALQLQALPRTGSLAAAASGPTAPTALSALLTLVLASDVLRRMLSRRTASTCRPATSRTGLRAASLEEAGMFRPSPPASDAGDGTTTFAAPALFAPADSRPVVLFDGSCTLCNWGVQLMLDYDSCSADSRGNLRLAALQSRVGALLLARLDDRTRGEVLRSAAAQTGTKKEEEDEDQGKDDGGGDEFKSIVVCGPDRTWTNTAAVLKMGRSMGFPFRPLALVAWLIPPFLRNLCYRWLSRNRKRLFGERGECRLWDDRWDTRFVDDCLLGGEGSQGGGAADDLFADPNAPSDGGADEEGGATLAAAAAAENVREGDRVRITSAEPVVVRHVEAFPHGVCVGGCTGVVEVVNANNLVVQFDLGETLGVDDAESSGEEWQFQSYVAKDQVTKIQ